MAFPANWINGTGLTLKLAATQYEAEITTFKENPQTIGGDSIQMADGSIVVTPYTSKVVSVTVNIVQGVNATALFRYLRETAPGAGTIVITGSTSSAPSVTNPKWTYTITGWDWPAIDFNPGSGNTVPVTFTVAANPVVATS